MYLFPAYGKALAFGPNSGRFSTSQAPALAVDTTPKGHKAAMRSPDAGKWSAAEHRELDNHVNAGSLELINYSEAR